MATAAGQLCGACEETAEAEFVATSFSRGSGDLPRAGLEGRPYMAHLWMCLIVSFMYIISLTSHVCRLGGLGGTGQNTPLPCAGENAWYLHNHCHSILSSSAECTRWKQIYTNVLDSAPCQGGVPFIPRLQKQLMCRCSCKWCDQQHLTN